VALTAGALVVQNPQGKGSCGSGMMGANWFLSAIQLEMVSGAREGAPFCEE